MKRIAAGAGLVMRSACARNAYGIADYDDRLRLERTIVPR